MEKVITAFKSINKRKFIKFLIVFLLVIAVIYVLLNIKLVLGAHLSKNSLTISAMGTTNVDYGIYDDNLLSATGEGVTLYKKNGKEKWKLKSNLLTPYLNINDKFIMASDLDGAEAFVLKKDNVYYSVNAENPICYSYVNKNAYSVIVTDETGYKSLVNVYDNNGSNIYKWYSGEWEIISAVLSDNNKNLAVAGLDTGGNSINSIITIFDVNKEDYQGQVVLQDTFLYTLKYTPFGVMALTDKSVILLDKKGRIKREYSLSGKAVDAFDFDDKNNLTLALSDNSDNGQRETLIVLSATAREKRKLKLDFKVNSVDYYKGDILGRGNRW